MLPYSPTAFGCVAGLEFPDRDSRAVQQPHPSPTRRTATAGGKPAAVPTAAGKRAVWCTTSPILATGAASAAPAAAQPIQRPLAGRGSGPAHLRSARAERQPVRAPQPWAQPPAVQHAGPASATLSAHAAIPSAAAGDPIATRSRWLLICAACWQHDTQSKVQCCRAQPRHVALAGPERWPFLCSTTNIRHTTRPRSSRVTVATASSPSRGRSKGMAARLNTASTEEATPPPRCAPSRRNDSHVHARDYLSPICPPCSCAG